MFKPAFVAVVAASVFSAVYAEDIEHISIYANRTATPEHEVLASVTVLERSDIIERQAADLPALLAQLPGINVSRDGGRGQTSGVYIRGGNAGHTLVIIDGVRSGSATLGYKSLAMLPLELIERIEVIRGPRAAWYGSDALSGVIAITTRRPEHAEVNAAIGSYGQAGFDVSVAQHSEQLILRATAGASRADGFNVRPALHQDKDGYRQKFVKVAADYKSSIGTFTTQADVNSGYYQFDTAWGNEDAANTLNRAYLLGYQHQLAGVEHQLQLSRNLDREVTFSSESNSPFDTARDELNYQLATAIGSAFNVLAGVNWYQETVEKAAPNYQQGSRINRAVFTGLNYQHDQLQLEAAGRRDVISQYGGQNTWQLAAGYQFNEYLSAHISRGSAFKAPSFNQLYWPDFGNPDLKPEQSVSDEVALHYQQKNTRIGVVWFDRDVTNLIQGIEEAQNVVLATVAGIELTWHQQWQQFDSNIAYTLVDSEDKSNGEKLLRRPKHTINWRGSYHSDSWSAFITYDYQSKTTQGFNWDTMTDYPQAGGFSLWGAGASYAISNSLTVRANVANLLDKNYYTSVGYATPGTNVGLSISYIPQ